MAGGGTAAAAAACRVAASTLLQGAFHSQLIYTLFIETTSPDPKTQLHMLLCTGELAVAIFPEVKETIVLVATTPLKLGLTLTFSTCPHARGMQCLSRKEVPFFGKVPTENKEFCQDRSYSTASSHKQLLLQQQETLVLNIIC